MPPIKFLAQTRFSCYAPLVDESMAVERDAERPWLALGQRTGAPTRYAPHLLEARPRLRRAEAAGVSGVDRWTAYEVCWLDGNGQPRSGALEMVVDARSTNFIESKSMKLYLSSFAMERVDSRGELLARLANDLSQASGAEWRLRWLAGLSDGGDAVGGVAWFDLDQLTLSIDRFQRSPELLALSADGTPQSCAWRWSAFQSVCPVTGQPDHAEILVDGMTDGSPLIAAGVLRYLASYRQEATFHEAAIESIFGDLERACAWRWLRVQGLFHRRGGIDISPMRTNRDDLDVTQMARRTGQ